MHDGRAFRILIRIEQYTRQCQSRNSHEASLLSHIGCNSSSVHEVRCLWLSQPGRGRLFLRLIRLLFVAGGRAHQAIGSSVATLQAGVES